MAQQAAREYTTCSNCEVEEAKESLYMCTKKSCSKFGEIFCKECGPLSHRSKDHSFEIECEHIKVVDPSVIEAYINDGRQIVQITLARHNDKELETRRTLTASASGSAAMISIGVMRFGEFALAAGYVTQAGVGVLGASGALGGIFVAVQETIVHTMRFMRGDIKTWKEYGYHMAKGWTTAAGCSLGGWVCASAGATIGLVGGPIGAIIGAVIGGIAGALAGAKLSRTAFERFFPDDKFESEQIGRREMIMDSLKLFGFTSIKDIENPEIFNTVELKKIYRTLARRYHPDRNKGSDESTQKFQEINAALGVLLTLLTTTDKGYVVKMMTQIKAIKWKNDIKDLKQSLVESNVMYIVDRCHRRDQRVTLEKISVLRKQDILELIKELNENAQNNRVVSVMDRNEFADIIATWNGTGLDHDFILRNEDSNDNNDENNNDENTDDEGNNVEAVINAEDVANDLMNDLMNDLKTHKLLDVVRICQEFDEEYSLESLVEYTKNDILEVINEINGDDTNNHKISVGRKNKFAKIICNFAAK